ncbi:MAG: hypothetical protein LBD16_05025 [Oscillospiraceae bacterium]|jgi:hypothetical protein|nr:hypothetical protein [Oscillospiraceae bacterium]
MNRDLLMSEGMKALRAQLGTVDTEKFIFYIKTEEPFDYTKWRENLFDDMNPDELLDAAAEYARTHPLTFNKELIPINEPQPV